MTLFPMSMQTYKRLSVEKAIWKWFRYKATVIRILDGRGQSPLRADAYIKQLASVMIPMHNGTVRSALNPGCG